MGQQYGAVTVLVMELSLSPAVNFVSWTVAEQTSSQLQPSISCCLLLLLLQRQSLR
jgi:hypothetical protein